MADLRTNRLQLRAFDRTADPADCRLHTARGLETHDDPRVVDTWPKMIPIAAEEVRAIEVYLGSLIDLLIQGNTTQENETQKSSR